MHWCKLLVASPLFSSIVSGAVVQAITELQTVKHGLDATRRGLWMGSMHKQKSQTLSSLLPGFSFNLCLNRQADTLLIQFECIEQPPAIVVQWTQL